ncbi:Bro-N domain-containing protein [Streptacidiphilus sp. MAP5-3]|uniref:BRO-N domain-containing protein n=1 Tax=unclassified Streptacidiphilus TaxID=2643834 RepID=UPI003515955F
MHTRTMNAEFPDTGQLVRVVTIDGEPWFATADVCRILGTTSPSRTNRMLRPGDHRVVNLRAIPHLDVVSEGGLYRLIMRCDNPTARPFQDWITGELLPAVRRGDTDLDEAPVGRIELHGHAFELYADGSLHCQHGPMDPVLPTPDEDDGPPYGPGFRCAEVERVGILGGRLLRPCPTVRLIDLARQFLNPPQPATALSRRPLLVISGEPREVVEVLNGVCPNGHAS